MAESFLALFAGGHVRVRHLFRLVVGVRVANEIVCNV